MQNGNICGRKSFPFKNEWKNRTEIIEQKFPIFKDIIDK